MPFTQRNTLNLAYKRVEPASQDTPEILFLGGFRSDMEGTKAQFLMDKAMDHGWGCTCFDYGGHGTSTGEFSDLTIEDWLADTLHIIDKITHNKLIVVGSSMGGWLMLLAALRRPKRIHGLVGIAAAPDFPTRLMHPSFTQSQKDELATQGYVTLPSFDGGHYMLKQQFFDKAGEHQLLNDDPIEIDHPLHLLHGTHDDAVPWEMSLEIMNKITSTQVNTTFIKGGDHRLSSDENLDLLWSAVLGIQKINSTVDSAP